MRAEAPSTSAIRSPTSHTARHRWAMSSSGASRVLIVWVPATAQRPACTCALTWAALTPRPAS